MDQFPDFSTLSPRERDCLRLYADRTVKEVAADLGISPDTAKTHLATARGKLGGLPSKAASRLLRSIEGPHLNGTSPDRVMSEATAPPASQVAPDQAIGADQKQTVLREQRAAFEHQVRLSPLVEMLNGVNPFWKVLLLLLAPVALASLVLLALALFGSFDQHVLPHLFPTIRPH